MISSTSVVSRPTSTKPQRSRTFAEPHVLDPDVRQQRALRVPVEERRERGGRDAASPRRAVVPVADVALVLAPAADAADDLAVDDDRPADRGRVGTDLRVVRDEGVPVARRERRHLGRDGVELVLEQDRQVLERRRRAGTGPRVDPTAGRRRGRATRSAASAASNAAAGRDRAPRRPRGRRRSPRRRASPPRARAVGTPMASTSPRTRRRSRRARASRIRSGPSRGGRPGQAVEEPVDLLERQIGVDGHGRHAPIDHAGSPASIARRRPAPAERETVHLDQQPDQARAGGRGPRRSRRAPLVGRCPSRAARHAGST